MREDPKPAKAQQNVVRKADSIPLLTPPAPTCKPQKKPRHGSDRDKKNRKQKLTGKIQMVGATGFEPATSCTRSKRSTRLSHAPTTVAVIVCGGAWRKRNFDKLQPVNPQRVAEGLRTHFRSSETFFWAFPKFGTGQTRKRAPIFLPRMRLLPTMVTARKTMAQTPRALAMYFPVPMSWKSS